MNEIEAKEAWILGQKYAFATASLILGICSFVGLLGLEKPILAIVFAWLALRATPAPALKLHRMWAKTGLVLGILVLVIVPIIIIVNFDELREIIQLLSKLDGGR
ncbi:MAG: hypothetical protein ACT4OT_08990 [Acidobacteriota bacterium]